MSFPGGYAEIEDWREGAIWTGRKRRRLGGPKIGGAPAPKGEARHRIRPGTLDISPVNAQGGVLQYRVNRVLVGWGPVGVPGRPVYA